VVPTSLASVLVFVASVGPGYAYVRLVEQWRPYVQRTALREAAEIVVSGSIATIAGVIVALLVLERIGFIDSTALVADPLQYAAVAPGHVGVGLLIVVVTSYGLAALVARFQPGKGARVYPDSDWYAMFERRLPKDNAIRVTVELRDGRRVTGLVAAFTSEPTPVDDRELTLVRSLDDTMKVTLAGDNNAIDIADQFMMLRGSDIAAIAATYVPTKTAPTMTPVKIGRHGGRGDL